MRCSRRRGMEEKTVSFGNVGLVELRNLLEG